MQRAWKQKAKNLDQNSEILQVVSVISDSVFFVLMKAKLILVFPVFITEYLSDYVKLKKKRFCPNHLLFEGNIYYLCTQVNAS